MAGLALAATTSPLCAQDAAFFETKVRPVLATNCYGCHSAAMAAPKGGVILDTKDGLRAVVEPGAKSI